MTTPLKTPFGTFQGKHLDGVTQYRGINYAILRDQLSMPEILTEYPNEVIDATHFGPRAPALDGCAFEQCVLIQCARPEQGNEVLKMNGTECLNLNITVPNPHREEKNGSDNQDQIVDKGLPVMVFIHGGGFIMGANSWPQYDMEKLVEKSVDMGMPIIGININYRLGILGNLTSEELRAAGYAGNNSLRDQKCALQWIRKNIGAFGGDAESITVCGESAGAASVLFHLHSAERLFKRCISMSGTPIMLQALSQEVVETSYTSIIREFGLEGASAEERINALRTAFPEELVSKTPLTIPLLPYLNGDIIPERATFATLAAKNHANLPGMQWCDQLMIGDCQHDGTVFHFQGLAQRKAGIAGTITSSFYTHLAPAAAHAVLEAYNITPSTPDNEAMQRIFDLATDIAYAVPALTYTRSFQGKTYAYHFNELNPWDGAFKGKSTHMLDVAFLFQHYNEYMAPKAQEVAKAIATDFIRFVNGVQPWAEFDEGERKVRTYGPSEKKVIGAVDENGWGNDRRDVLWKMSEKGEVDLDDLMSAWNIFIAGN